MFVSIKCPACGAECEIDESREFVFCNFCGTKLYNQKAQVELVGAVTVDSSPTVSNLLARADRFREEGDERRAIEYYERVLDIDVDNEEASRAVDEIKGIIRKDNVFVVVDPVYVMGKKEEILIKAKQKLSKKFSPDPSFDVLVSIDDGEALSIGLNDIASGMYSLGTHYAEVKYRDLRYRFSFVIRDIDQTRYIVVAYNAGSITSRYGDGSDLPDPDCEETRYKNFTPNTSMVSSAKRANH